MYNQLKYQYFNLTKKNTQYLYQNNNIINMEVEKTFFSENLRQYITMSLSIWPGLKAGLLNDDLCFQLNENTLLPSRPYSSMNEKQLLDTLLNDFTNFILQHDVNEQHIEDYLNDILELLNVEEQTNCKGATFISREIIKLMKQLESGNNERVKDFHIIYDKVKNSSIRIEKNEESDQQNQQDYQEKQDEQNNSQYSDISEEQQEKSKQKLQENLDEDNDGWTIVKKKR